MRLGGTRVVMEKFDAETALRLIERHRVTHSQWVPTMFVRLLRLPEPTRTRYDLSSHRFAIHAAAPCPIPIKRAMLAWWGPILHEYYSGTEGNGQTAIAPDEWLAHPGSVGRPILGELHILDDAGNEVPTGATGTVYFAGGPAFEYYKDPDKTARSRSREGWSTLGDIGHVDGDGYLYLTDRASQMIISGGVNIYPQEVENVLVTDPRVADAAVFGVADDEFGERVCAAVELAMGVSPTDALAAELIAYCRARLAHYKCPKSIEFHARLPRHETGKLYKRRLVTKG
jgi:acyl-CoA synthetase (AMP-forming)/AMP-acid ligase II